MKQISILAIIAAVGTAQQLFQDKTFLNKPQLYPISGNGLSQEEMVRDIQFRCQYMAGLNFYDLQPLAIYQRYYEIPAADQSGRTFRVSFCEELPEEFWCSPNEGTMAVMIEPEEKGKECVTLSGPSPTDNARFDVSDPDNNDGLKIIYNGGNSSFQFTVDIQCNPDTDFKPVNSSGIVDMDMFIAFQSRLGCKYDQLSEIWSFFENNKWAMFALFVIIGGGLVFAGFILLKPTLFLAGVLLSCFIIMYIFYTTFLKTNTESWVGWAVIGGSIVVGMIIGFIFSKFVKVGAFALAAWGGFALGLLLYNALLYKLDSNIAFWGTTCFCALIMGVLAVFLFDHIIIISTSLLGSFMFCYGIGLVAGHYPNPFTIVELIKNGQFKEMDPYYYAYMGGNLALLVIGLIIQYSHRRKIQKLEDQRKRH